MKRDEIVTALRCCAGDSCEGCPYDEIFAVEDAKCIGETMGYAADLIENQQRHIQAKLQGDLLQRNAELLKAREKIKNLHNCIGQLDSCVDQLDEINSGLMAANEKLAADRKALINELCQYCGKYKHAHEGACDGCRWKQ